jgi:hypothetical protein
VAIISQTWVTPRNLRVENEMIIRNQSPSFYDMQRSDLHVLAELFTGCITVFQPAQSILQNIFGCYLAQNYEWSSDKSPKNLTIIIIIICSRPAPIN